MFACTYGLAYIPTAPALTILETKPITPTKSSSLSTLNDDASESDSEPEHRKLKGSSQLKRWSRARAIRSGRKLGRPGERPATSVDVAPQVRSTEATPDEFGSTAVVGLEEGRGADVKSIYMVSDGTGWTAEHSVNAALGQFDHCLVDRGCPVNTHLFSGGSEEVSQAPTMFACTYGLAYIPTAPAITILETKPITPTKSSSLSTLNDDASESDSEPEHRKLKGSSQLKRWSRARAIRSGRKLSRPGERPATSVDVAPQVRSTEATPDEFGSTAVVGLEEGRGADVKSIYMVSDGTGWTAEHSVNAALGQFDHCLVDRGCPVSTHLFSGIEDVEQLMEIVMQAAKEGAMILYTLADPSMAEAANHACRIWGIPSTDILSPITEAIASHLGVSPSGLPRGAPGRLSHLTEDYFRRIEAIEFTIKHDDGALPENLKKADIVLVGVSRTGKTPLSTYLAHKGYKVANVPLVMGIDLPKALFEVDPEKVYALTINPSVLQTIRRSRAKTLGLSDELRGNYSDMDHVRRELDHASKIFAKNPVWPVIEVTGKAIEETAAVILRLYYDRKNKYSMSRISKRY